MGLPFFFVKDLDVSGEEIVLDEDNSRHMAQVLRMEQGEEVFLLNGRGIKARAQITDNHKKHCSVKIHSIEKILQPGKKVAIAISLLKNASRFEWFLEKATEIGVTDIIPLICSRTEKQKFRSERLHSILVSAMMQSQQAWLPEMSDPVLLKAYMEKSFEGEKFIAHCRDEEERNSIESSSHTGCTILIGPEGDFSPEEIELALSKNFIPVTLGNTRLRTETAGIVAATLLCRLP